jgi:hypothetical protein
MIEFVNERKYKKENPGNLAAPGVFEELID